MTAAIIEDQFHTPVLAKLRFTRFEGPPETSGLRMRPGEIDVDRIRLFNGRHERCFAFPDQGTFGDHGAPNPPRNRGKYMGMFQVQFGLDQRRFGLLEPGHRLVDLLLADRLDLE